MILVWKADQTVNGIRRGWSEAQAFASGPVATVERDDSTEQEPWKWTVSDWPVFPDEDCESEDPNGRSATQQEAKLAAEAAYPTESELLAIKERAAEEWQAHHEQKVGPNN